MIKAVLFDLDGTLRDTRDIIYAALEHTFDQHKLPKPGRQELAPYIHHHSKVQKQFAPDVTLEAFEAVYEPKVQQMLPSVVLYDGAVETLRSLHEQGYKVGIVTAAKSAPKDVKTYGMAAYLDVLVSANDIARHKPDPEGLNIALQKLDITPEEAVYVGDMTTDMLAAKAARLGAVIGITHGFDSRQALEEAGADYIIDSLPGLTEVINAL